MRLARLLALILCLISSASLAANGNGNPSGNAQSRIFSLNGSPLLTPLPGTVIQMANANGVGTRLEVDSFASGGHISFARIDGTAAAPTAVQSADVLGGPNAWGYNGTAPVGPTASIDFVASQNWTTGANGTQINFWTTLNNTTTPSLNFTIGNDGGLFSATATGGDKGPGTGNFNALFVGGVAVGANSSAALSALTSATTGNSIDSGANVQSWAWGTLSTQTAFSLIAPNATTGTVLKITSTGTGNALMVNGNVGGTFVTPVANGGSGYNFPHFYPKLNNVINSTSGNIVRICTVGDSETFGHGSGNANVNAPALSWPTQMAGLISSNYGVKAHWNSFIGDGQNSVNFGSSDTRITLGSSWSQSGDFISLGLDTFKATTSTNSINFLPVTAVDTFKIFYVVNAGEGSFTVNVNGGSTLATVNAATGTNNSIGSVTVTTTLGTNTVNVFEASGSIHVIGVEAWDSTQSWVSVINMAADGSTSTQWAVATNAFSPANGAAYQAIGCDLTIINLGTNDEDTGVPVLTFTSNMQAIISAALTSGDVMLMTHVPSNPAGGGSSVALQNSFMQAERGLKVTNSLSIADTYQRWGSYANASNWNVYSDTFAHPNTAGYNDNAQANASVFMPPKNAQAPFAGAGNVPLNLSGNLSGSLTPLLNIKNQNASDFDMVGFTTSNASSYNWRLGASNSSNTYFLYDNNTQKFVINVTPTTDFVGIGTSPSSPCNSIEALGVCGNFLVNGAGHIYQIGTAASNTNGYLETYQVSLSNTTSLMNGVLVFGGQNCTDCWGEDLGYNSTTSRYRTRVFGSTLGDISLAFHTHGTAPTGQSSFTDGLVLRGDTGFIGIGTPTPSTLLTLSQTTTSGPVATFTNSAGTCTHTPGSSSETVSCSSDIRLKKNIEDAPDVLPWLQTFRIRQYDLIATGEHVYDGVVAQEVAKKHHRMVHEGPNGYLTVDAPDNWTLVKAIQEQQSEIAAVTPGAFPFHKCFFSLLVCAN